MNALIPILCIIDQFIANKSNDVIWLSTIKIIFMGLARFIDTKKYGSTGILLAILLMLCACSNPQHDSLAEREARIRTKELELIALLAELVEQKKSLKLQQSDKLAHAQENQENAALPTATSDPCDTPQPQETQQPTAKTMARTILGGLENVFLDPPGMEFSARIDTGAQTSSLHALDIVEFERDGKPFVKFNMIHPETKEKIQLTRRLRRYVRVKELGNRESQRRPVVRMRVVLADIDERINFTLENRSRFKHQVLIGRNLLQDLAIVDVSKKYTTAKTDRPQPRDTK